MSTTATYLCIWIVICLDGYMCVMPIYTQGYTHVGTHTMVNPILATAPYLSWAMFYHWYSFIEPRPIVIGFLLYVDSITIPRCCSWPNTSSSSLFLLIGVLPCPNTPTAIVQHHHECVYVSKYHHMYHNMYLCNVS